MFIFSYFPLLLPLCITNVISKCKQQVRRWCRQGPGSTLTASITPFPFRPPFAKFALPPSPPSPLRRDQCYQCHRLFRPPVPPQHPRPARIRLISPISKPGVRAMNHRRRGGRLRPGGRCDLWPPARPRDGSHMRAHVPLTHTHACTQAHEITCRLRYHYHYSNCLNYYHRGHHRRHYHQSHFHYLDDIAELRGNEIGN